MKKINILLIAIILGTAPLFAFNTPTPKNIEQQLIKEITLLLEKPKFELDEEIINADVQFTLNNLGEIIVLNVDADTEKVINYIKTRLNDQKINLSRNNEIKIYNISLKIRKL